MTSAFCVLATNQASSPNRPNLYFDRRKSLGKPHATDTKCGLTLLLGSTNVEKPLRNARDTSRVVQQIDCIFSSLLSLSSFSLLFSIFFYFKLVLRVFFLQLSFVLITVRFVLMEIQLPHQIFYA